MQIADGDAAERLHPCLESAVAGVDALGMEDAVVELCSGGDVDRLMEDAGLASDEARAASGIGAQRASAASLGIRCSPIACVVRFSSTASLVTFCRSRLMNIGTCQSSRTPRLPVGGLRRRAARMGGGVRGTGVVQRRGPLWDRRKNVSSASTIPHNCAG